ncbi:MAG: UDP-N-acetylmuramoyl-tripeptide--D-alanyl-D-alanine ligase [Pseudomonadota bacterium]|jgi:UDP-N-acetylmuramoyl-tripeptide--D-alanyl-D-alanine ligase|nr:UDP-N-acetylmuramoyl-tripeptide--D-alanyl-D-alanine ligase [Alphaproteobacteria bacterium]
MARWNNESLKNALKLEIPFSCNTHTLCIDSRQLQQGDMFIAIPGKQDGHDFVRQALDNGASCAIVERAPINTTQQDKLIYVKSSQQALNDLGQYSRSQAKILKAIAVTGSVGKTTTKEMLRSVLHHFGSTIYSRASYNNHLGVPLSLAMLHPDSVFGVFEVGMNHKGEILPLAQMIKPDIAIITTVAPSHIGNMGGSLEEIADEKSSIFAALNNNGTALLHGDHPLFERMKKNAQNYGVKNIFTAGRSAGSDARLLHCQPIFHGKNSLLTAEIFGKIVAYPLQFPGEHYAFDSLYALLCGEILGLDLGLIMQHLAKVQPVVGRGQMINLQLENGKTIFVFDDAYNANPTSMAAGLKSFCTMNHDGRKIAIIGQMGELGENSETYHIEMAKLINTLNFDCVHVIGPQAKCLFETLQKEKRGLWFEKVDDFKEEFISTLSGGESIFLKGSLSQRLQEVVTLLKTQLKAVA